MEHRAFFPALTRAVKYLIVVNAAVFVANLLLGGSLSMSRSGEHWFALTWSGLWQGYGLGLLRLCTAAFTHDYFSASHFVYNMVALYLFGHVVEGGIGFRGMLKFYLGASGLGWIVHLLLMWATGHLEVPAFGASGAVFGTIVFAACLMPRARTFFFLELRVLAAILVGIGVYQGIIEMREGYSDGVAHGGHVGGALFGFLAWRFGWLRDYRTAADPFGSLVQRFRSWRRRQQAASVQQHEQQLDEILAKVKDRGLQSLSPQERRFLDKLGQKGRKS